jgi:hypothetical protein
MKQLRSFIGLEQGFVKQVRELALVILRSPQLYSRYLVATSACTTLSALMPSVGAGGG